MGIPDELGPILIGGLVSAALYGITTLQTYVYFMHYVEDASTKKFLVAAVWVLDTLHVSLTCHILYYYMITNYGVPTSLEYNIWSLTVCTPQFPHCIDLECFALLDVVSGEYIYGLYNSIVLCKHNILSLSPSCEVVSDHPNYATSSSSLRVWHGDSCSGVRK